MFTGIPTNELEVESLRNVRKNTVIKIEIFPEFFRLLRHLLTAVEKGHSGEAEGNCQGIKTPVLKNPVSF